LPATSHRHGVSVKPKSKKSREKGESPKGGGENFLRCKKSSGEATNNKGKREEYAQMEQFPEGPNGRVKGGNKCLASKLGETTKTGKMSRETRAGLPIVLTKKTDCKPKALMGPQAGVE